MKKQWVLEFFAVILLSILPSLTATPFSQEVDEKIASIKNPRGLSDIIAVVSWFNQQILADPSRKTYGYANKFNRTHFCEPLKNAISQLQSRQKLNLDEVKILTKTLDELITNFTPLPQNTAKRALDAHTDALTLLNNLRATITPPPEAETTDAGLQSKNAKKRSTDKAHLQKLLDENYEIYQKIEQHLVSLSENTKLTINSVNRLFDEYEKRAMELNIMQEVLSTEEKNYNEMIKEAIEQLETELKSLVTEKEREIQTFKDRLGL